MHYLNVYAQISLEIRLCWQSVCVSRCRGLHGRFPENAIKTLLTWSWNVRSYAALWGRREERQKIYQILSTFLNTMCTFCISDTFLNIILDYIHKKSSAKIYPIIYGKNCHSQEVCYYIGRGSWNGQNKSKFQLLLTHPYSESHFDDI